MKTSTLKLSTPNGDPSPTCHDFQDKNTRPVASLGRKPLAVTMDDFCALVGVRRTSGFRLLKEGAVEGLLIGRRRLITMESIEALIESSKTGAVK